ncbi:ATP-binding protein, partial [candidate division KSB1 bacterium]|nr:ATP-binding protein [candidate division KSB1 bacterium]
MNRPTKNFGLIEHDPGNSNSLSGRLVQAIHEDRTGALWLGTEYGLNKLDRDTGIFTKYTFDSDTTGVVGANVVSGIAEDSNGRLWLGTRGGGLIRFDPQTGEYRQYRHEPADSNSLASDQIGRVYFDSFGTLWLGTTEHVLSRLLPEDQDIGRFTHFQPQPENKTGLKNQMGFVFLEDSYGGFWMGTHLTGLYRFDRETEKFTSYQHDQKDPNSLSSNIINGMYETRSEHDTTLWVGTGNGLNRLDRRSQTFKRIYNKQPGGSDFIISLTGDAGNNLWMQNQKGISKFDTHHEIFINYAGSRGLPSDMPNTNGYHKNRKGEIFFGGMGGMIHFHPDSILSNPHVPPVVLTDFKILNEPAVLDSSITVKKLIDLAHDQNFFSFEFAALDYTDSKKNQYAYKLEGLDENWIDSGNRRFANYTAVPPGNYIFRVKGSNNDGIWNEDGVSLTINIRPPWWQSGWAYGSYLLLFVAALYAWRRFELRRIQLRNELKSKKFEAEKLKEVDHLKSRFFASISHEFRTPLTLILGPVEKWLSRIQQAEMKTDFHIVQRNARRLEQLINQLLDLSKLEAGKMRLQARPENMVALLHMITMTFESLAKQKKIDLQFRATEEEIIAYVEREKLETIVTNLLANAFKFTGEKGKVAVAVAAAVERKKLPTATASATAPGFVEIRVSDTGVGIPADQLDKVFDRFHQVDNSASLGGTGIWLALTKELVELHHGEIAVESEVGKGTTFTVRFKLGNAHLKPEQIVETV